jgi:protein-disulfide isomerase/uncharacterized membrane protein
VKTVILNRVALILSFVGIFVSGVLSIGARYEGHVPCGMSRGCERVASDASSHLLFGIPNADIGLAVYILLAAFAYLRLVSPGGSRLPLTIGYLLTAVGSLVSIGLTWYSLSIVHAACPWCLTSALVMILLLLIHAVLVQRGKTGEDPVGNFDTILLSSLVLSTLILLGVVGVGIANRAATLGLGEIKLENIDPKTIIPEDVHVYGDPKAPVTIVEFGDLVCPQCREEFPKIKQYVGAHAGQVRYVFRHYPLVMKEGHEAALPAAILAEIADEDNMFWQYLGMIYGFEAEKKVDINDALDVAEKLGMDTAKALKRIGNKDDPAFIKVNTDLRDGTAIGVQGTPTFIIVAPGVKPRPAMAETLFRDLDRSEYSQFLKNAKQ